MGRINIINDNVFIDYAKMISQRMNTKVLIQGNQFCATEDTIMIPHMDQLDEATFEVLVGGLLHECGHIKYTHYGSTDIVQNRIIFQIANALEDIFIEDKLDKRFKGARQFLESVHFWVSKMREKALVKKWGKNVPEFLLNLDIFLSDYIVWKRGYSDKEPANKELLEKMLEVDTFRTTHSRDSVKKAIDFAAKIGIENIPKPKIPGLEQFLDRKLAEIEGSEKEISAMKELIENILNSEDFSVAMEPVKETAQDGKLMGKAADVLGAQMEDIKNQIQNMKDELKSLKKPVEHSSKSEDEENEGEEKEFDIEVIRMFNVGDYTIEVID